MNQFISVKIGDIWLLDILKCLRGATGLESFLKAFKTSVTKRILPYESFNQPHIELPPYNAPCSNFLSFNPLGAKYIDYVNLQKNGMTTEQAIVKLKLSKPPPKGIENYQYLEKIWKREQLSSSKVFLSR